MTQKTLLTSFLSFVLSLLLFYPEKINAQPCIDNDDCSTAFELPLIVSDAGFTCIDGCNLFASPDPIINACQMGTFPTVWYHFTSDDLASTMNLSVKSSFFETPVISVFTTGTDCNNLVPVYLTNYFYPCVTGTNGEAKAIGTRIDPLTDYYIAVSSLMSIGGDFELCVSVLQQGSVCTIDRSIEIVSRSNPGPLEGPFDPNEEVSICMNVYHFTAANNGCQWFQGLVPVFGNGWDPKSFDANGHPLNTTVNNIAIGVPGNGVYSATWDWFTDVDYHYDHPNMVIADLDGNGTVDICNNAFEEDCPVGSSYGACCSPCWGDQLGSILPGGWFAYGINGTCPTPGPPVRVDWGDGNTCGSGMGPWKFCFDLTTKDIPDCMEDSTSRDLSLGFFTFADGETGAWTGDQSVCALDGPIKLSLQAKCGRTTQHEHEILPTLYSGDTLRYIIDDREGVSHWEWNISPLSATSYLINSGANGFLIEVPLSNETDDSIIVTGTFIGYIESSTDNVLKTFSFTLLPGESVSTEEEGDVKEKFIQLYPHPASDLIQLSWTFDFQKEMILDIYNLHGIPVTQHTISQQEGKQKQIDLHDLKPGVYILQVRAGNHRYVERFLKI